jgi:hypothetical protein
MIDRQSVNRQLYALSRTVIAIDEALHGTSNSPRLRLSLDTRSALTSANRALASQIEEIKAAQTGSQHDTAAPKDQPAADASTRADTARAQAIQLDKSLPFGIDGAGAVQQHGHPKPAPAQPIAGQQINQQCATILQDIMAAELDSTRATIQLANLSAVVKIATKLNKLEAARLWAGTAKLWAGTEKKARK